MARLPDYMCPFSACDGSGWMVDERARTATRCQCMPERIRLRDQANERRNEPPPLAGAHHREEGW